MKKYIIGGSLFTLSLIADIVSKYLVVKNLYPYDKIDFLGGFFRLSLTYNRGGVWGIFQGHKNTFLIISIIVLIIMIAYYVYEKNKTLLFTIAMSLIMAGAVGNILDRLIASRPGVVDFISVGFDSFYRWPTFNIADSSVVVGAFLLMIVFYKFEKNNKAEK